MLFAARSRCPRQALGVRDEQVVADELHPVPEPIGQLAPSLPVVLGQAVLEAHDRVAIGPIGPEVDELAPVSARSSFASE
jgi:hypothetical protein